MSSPPAIPARPKLAPGVRLHHDATRQAWVLLAPERVVELEGPAREIVQRCDGRHAPDQIIDALAALYTAARAEIAADVTDLLAELAARRLIV
ncbi:MAG: pyrroloquinoline quinone biosynthesis peptide chaperone PqqD [Rhodospirillales bacterium]|nr:pyrroloquinoline quinone biosynthesis peptide chaperone PqqD [Rhodospirillales bacterium]